MHIVRDFLFVIIKILTDNHQSTDDLILSIHKYTHINNNLLMFLFLFESKSKLEGIVQSILIDAGKSSQELITYKEFTKVQIIKIYPLKLLLLTFLFYFTGAALVSIRLCT